MIKSDSFDDVTDCFSCAKACFKGLLRYVVRRGVDCGWLVPSRKIPVKEEKEKKRLL